MLAYVQGTAAGCLPSGERAENNICRNPHDKSESQQQAWPLAKHKLHVQLFLSPSALTSMTQLSQPSISPHLAKQQPLLWESNCEAGEEWLSSAKHHETRHMTAVFGGGCTYTAEYPV